MCPPTYGETTVPAGTGSRDHEQYCLPYFVRRDAAERGTTWQLKRLNPRGITRFIVWLHQVEMIADAPSSLLRSFRMLVNVLKTAQGLGARMPLKACQTAKVKRLDRVEL